VPIVTVAPDGARAPALRYGHARARRVPGATRITSEGTQRINRAVGSRLALPGDHASDRRRVGFVIDKAGEVRGAATALDGKRRPIEAAFGISRRVEPGSVAALRPRADPARCDKASYKPAMSRG